MCDEHNTNASANLGPRSYALRMTRAEWPGGTAYHAVTSLGSQPW